MNKKTIIPILIVLAAVLLGAFLYYTYSKKTPVPVGINEYSNAMGGKITEIKSDGTITIEGTTWSSKPGSKVFVTRTVVFTANSQTVFTKTVLSAPPGTKLGELYKPIEKEVPGNKAELAVGTRIWRAESNDDLFISGHAIAKLINYASNDFTVPPQ